MPIYRAPNNPFSDKLLKWARSMGGKLKTIPKSKTGTRQLVKALQEGAHIGMLIDQKYNEGIEADFMGRPAMTSPVYAQLAQKFDIPLIPLRIERTEGPNFRVTVFPPLETRNKNIEEIIDESHKLLGNWIKEKPEQWLWLHRRWDSKKLKENNDA
jgi:KDO2-lipid IV(A) lauroyltransferase